MYRVTYKLAGEKHWREAGYILKPQEVMTLLDKTYRPEAVITEPGDYIFTSKDGGKMEVNIEIGVY